MTRTQGVAACGCVHAQEDVSSDIVPARSVKLGPERQSRERT